VNRITRIRDRMPDLFGYRLLEFFTVHKSQAIGGNHGPHH
jgi:hypothetical protein